MLSKVICGKGKETFKEGNLLAKENSLVVGLKFHEKAIKAVE